MIIIEGKAGKSRVLQDIINNQMRNRSVVVFDSVGIRGLRVPDGVQHFMLDGASVEEVVEEFMNNAFQFYEIDWIVFSVNADIMSFDLGIFKNLDRRYNHNFIITVQNNALDEVNVYYA
ncbi:hypothetical protein [Paenibacillus agilis]|uniref:Uncharacterized protein n=1 Tax=Paenibacillus agilis TaxID=3020863 RepID=A0A559IEM9_9BACL|nr:hypothetical protein [Paenibacillus agilis]TVX85970.1 hypothetical protein FPZ44_23750 [Paenibacillus agilis]